MVYLQEIWSTSKRPGLPPRDLVCLQEIWCASKRPGLPPRDLVYLQETWSTSKRPGYLQETWLPPRDLVYLQETWSKRPGLPPRDLVLRPSFKLGHCQSCQICDLVFHSPSRPSSVPFSINHSRLDMAPNSILFCPMT